DRVRVRRRLRGRQRRVRHRGQRGRLAGAHAGPGRGDRRDLLLLGDHRAHLDRGLRSARWRHPLAPRQPCSAPAVGSRCLRPRGRARVLARPRPVTPAQSTRARRGGRAPARCRRGAGEAPGLRGRGPAHGLGRRLRRADRLRGPDRAPRAPHDARPRQPHARAHGLPRRGTLPPRRRHARPYPHRAGGAAGGRDHLVLRRPVLRLSSALALRADRAVTPLVELREVEFAYPAAGGPVLRRPFAIRALTVTVEDGEIFGVIGPNASGKTTLIRLLSRVLVPARGEILIAGRPLGALARADVARDIAVVPQDVPQGFPYTVEELVLMGRYPHSPRRLFETDDDREHARQALAATGALDLR